MAKNEARARKSAAPEAASEPAQESGGPPGDGGVGLWVDEYGRQCIGSECFHTAVDIERKEIRVVIDESGPCGGASQEDIGKLVDSLKGVVGAGADTVYQTHSRKG